MPPAGGILPEASRRMLNPVTQDVAEELLKSLEQGCIRNIELETNNCSQALEWTLLKNLYIDFVHTPSTYWLATADANNEKCNRENAVEKNAPKLLDKEQASLRIDHSNMQSIGADDNGPQQFICNNSMPTGSEKKKKRRNRTKKNNGSTTNTNSQTLELVHKPLTNCHLSYSSNSKLSDKTDVVVTSTSSKTQNLESPKNLSALPKEGRVIQAKKNKKNRKKQRNLFQIAASSDYTSGSKVNDSPTKPLKNNILQDDGTKNIKKIRHLDSKVKLKNPTPDDSSKLNMIPSEKIIKKEKSKNAAPSTNTSGKKLKDKIANRDCNNNNSSKLSGKKKKVIEETTSVKYKYVAIDCEMVTVEPNLKALARVSIVDQEYNILLDKYVKPKGIIIDYKTEVSGIRPADVENGENYEQVREEVIEILKEKIIVGHSLNRDFKVLNINYPYLQVRDTATYEPFRIYATKGWTPSLKSICEAVLGYQIQNGEHCSVEDARVVMALYNTVSNEWEKRKCYKKKFQLY